MLLNHLILAIESLIRHYGSVGVFTASFVEEVIPLIPSGLVVMGSGFAMLQHTLVSPASLLYLLVHVALPLSAGFTLGSLLVYALCYAFGEKLLHRYGSYVGLSPRKLEKIHNMFQNGHRDELMLCGLRMLPLIPSPALDAVAGLLKIGFWRYVTATFLGTLVKTFAISFVGWQAGRYYGRYVRVANQAEHYIIIAFLLGVLGWIIWRNMKKGPKPLS